MTEHKAMAENCLARAEFTEAQVHATLYHAEQQRIANLIKYCNGYGVYLSDIQATHVEIREGLGLS